MFKSFAISALAAAAVVAVASPAGAATVVKDLGTITVPPTQTFTPSVTFTRADNGKMALYEFTIAQAMTLTASSFTNSAAGGAGQFDITGLDLYSGTGNGGTLLESGTIGTRQSGTMTAFLDTFALDMGSYTIALTGNALSVPASVGSSITFAAAVPEPASWAMMIAGFGLVGGMARSRKVRAAIA